jgi:anti-sigma-K factor RskA
MSDRDLMRIEELLIDRALGELTDEQSSELTALLADHPDADNDELEWVVAEATAALLGDQRLEKIPEGLANAVIARAVADTTPDIAPDRGAAQAGHSNAWFGTVGWIAAAAALVGWLLLPNLMSDSARNSPPTLAQMRDSLISGGAQVVQIPWTATEDPAAVSASGDVVWSTSLQTGFMRFTGLETNDPTVFQYQLWIFDATRDERFPVDGGVFDIGPTGEILVQIDPRIDVRTPTLFAITIEPPGGVVVSDRERIVLVASTG